MLPDGTYVMSQTQVASAIDVPEIYIRRFCGSDTLKTLLGNDFTFDNSDLKYQDATTGRGKSGRIKVMPLRVAAIFWGMQGNKGNALGCACMVESLERRRDRIFGVRKTEQKYEREQASKAIGLSHIYAVRFLKSDTAKLLLGKDYTVYTLGIVKDNEGKRRDCFTVE